MLSTYTPKKQISRTIFLSPFLLAVYTVSIVLTSNGEQVLPAMTLRSLLVTQTIVALALLACQAFVRDWELARVISFFLRQSIWERILSEINLTRLLISVELLLLIIPVSMKDEGSLAQFHQQMNIETWEFYRASKLDNYYLIEDGDGDAEESHSNYFLTTLSSSVCGCQQSPINHGYMPQMKLRL